MTKRPNRDERRRHRLKREHVDGTWKLERVIESGRQLLALDLPNDVLGLELGRWLPRARAAVKHSEASAKLRKSAAQVIGEIEELERAVS